MKRRLLPLAVLLLLLGALLAFIATRSHEPSEPRFNLMEWLFPDDRENVPGRHDTSPEPDPPPMPTAHHDDGGEVKR
jgi:hypothetical protein